MKQSTQWIDHNGLDGFSAPRQKRLSYFRFLMRYPIFLLFFGPPIFRPIQGIDATKGSLDIWAFLQVALLGSVAFRALLRLATNEEIVIPKRIQSILRLAFILGFIFLVTAVYSPSHLVSAAYAILYLMAIICVLEFVADIYRTPPDWMQCLRVLRMTSLILFGLVLVTILFSPGSVVAIVPGIGYRLNGGAVAPVGLICSIMAIISAHSFLFSLEPKSRSIFIFLAGLTGSLITQSRGTEIALFLSLVILMAVWAKTSKRTAHLLIAGLIGAILLFTVMAGAIGGEQIWNRFNRGDIESAASGSGRTEIWGFVIDYCMAHPQGMGYVAGFRVYFKQHFSLGSGLVVEKIGAAHNSFMDVLADAGWLALAVYLIMLVKIIAFGWRYAKRRGFLTQAVDIMHCQAIQCAMILLFFCFADGMVDSEFALPLRTAFYAQNIFIAIILGASGRLLAASRARSISSMHYHSMGVKDSFIPTP